MVFKGDFFRCPWTMTQSNPCSRLNSTVAGRNTERVRISRARGELLEVWTIISSSSCSKSTSYPAFTEKLSRRSVPVKHKHHFDGRLGLNQSSSRRSFCIQRIIRNGRIDGHRSGALEDRTSYHYGQAISSDATANETARPYSLPGESSEFMNSSVARRETICRAQQNTLRQTTFPKEAAPEIFGRIAPTDGFRGRMGNVLHQSMPQRRGTWPIRSIKNTLLQTNFLRDPSSAKSMLKYGSTSSSGRCRCSRENNCFLGSILLFRPWSRLR
jgi:hypothetical protein